MSMIPVVTTMQWRHPFQLQECHPPTKHWLFQALLVPPLYLGRVARRLKGPNSAKVDIYVYQRKPSRNSKLTGHHNLTLVDGQNSVVFVMQMVQFASVVKFSQVPQPTCFAKSKWVKWAWNPGDCNRCICPRPLICRPSPRRLSGRAAECWSKVEKGDFQVEGCWTLAIVAYLAFASLVSVIRTQVLSKSRLRKF